MLSGVDQTNTNIYTNIWPQHPQHNQRMYVHVQGRLAHKQFSIFQILLTADAWLMWENHARTLAKEMGGDVYVITGANAEPSEKK